jgi:hypothetical protein
MKIIRRLVMVLMAVMALVSVVIADTGPEAAASDLCPDQTFSENCSVARTFTGAYHAIVLVENRSFRQTLFALVSKKDDAWTVVTSGRESDLEVMAGSPDDPFAFESHPMIKQAVPAAALKNILDQANAYFSERYN